MSKDPHRFTPTAFFIWGGLLIWMANFLFVYVFAALACARRFAHVTIMGVAVVPLTTTISSLIACIATGVLMWSALTRLRRDPAADQHTAFIRFLAIAGAALALVAIVWMALPPLLVRAGC